MKKFLCIYILLLIPNLCLSEDGFHVHVLNKDIFVPLNCSFYARPAIIASEISFNCSYFKPNDVLNIYFAKASECENYNLSNNERVINTDITIDSIRYIESTSEFNNKRIITRLVYNDEECIRVLGFYKDNIDNIMKNLWYQ